jgi:hypothetical protein
LFEKSDDYVCTGKKVAHWKSVALASHRLPANQGCQIWFVFKPKIQIWVTFGGPWNGKCFTTIKNILWSFGNLVALLVYFPPFLVLCQEISGNPGANNKMKQLCPSQ